MIAAYAGSVSRDTDPSLKRLGKKGSLRTSWEFGQ